MGQSGARDLFLRVCPATRHVTLFAERVSAPRQHVIIIPRIPRMVLYFYLDIPVYKRPFLHVLSIIRLPTQSSTPAAYYTHALISFDAIQGHEVLSRSTGVRQIESRRPLHTDRHRRIRSGLGTAPASYQFKCVQEDRSVRVTKCSSNIPFFLHALRLTVSAYLYPHTPYLDSQSSHPVSFSSRIQPYPSLNTSFYLSPILVGVTFVASAFSHCL